MHKLVQLSRAAVDYKLKRLKLSAPPCVVSIEATNVCNFRCRFCAQSLPGHRERRKQGMLDSAGFAAFVRRVKESGTASRRVGITLDGEPTLNEELPEFIRIAREWAFFPRFSSNGYLLSPELADRLAAAGPFLAAIDFSCDASYFEKCRGFPGSFQRVKANLLYLVQLARRNPAVRLQVADISAFAGGDRTQSLRRMRQLLSEGGPLPPNVRTLSRVFHNFCGLLGAGKRQGYIVCPYPWVQLVSTWNGDIVACCRDTVGQTILGNVFDKPIMEIWSGVAYQEFRRALVERRVQDVAACRACDMPYSRGSVRWDPVYLLEGLLRQ